MGPPPPHPQLQQPLPQQQQPQHQQQSQAQAQHQQIAPQNLLQHPQAHQFDYPQMSLNQSNMLPLRYDISSYIQLIENEKYYTLLDLTNEIDIWKSIVPTLCLRTSDKDSFY